MPSWACLHLHLLSDRIWIVSFEPVTIHGLSSIMKLPVKKSCKDRGLQIMSWCLQLECIYFSGKIKQCSTGSDISALMHKNITSDMPCSLLCHYGLVWKFLPKIEGILKLHFGWCLGYVTAGGKFSSIGRLSSCLVGLEMQRYTGAAF